MDPAQQIKLKDSQRRDPRKYPKPINAPVVCIASGASLTAADVEYCRYRAHAVLVVKECCKLAPWANILYAADGDWWDHWQGMADFEGEKVTVNEAAAQRWGLSCLRYHTGYKWHNGEVIATGGNSGFQLLNLANIRYPGRSIILLGYDMGHDADSPKHWWTGTIKRPIRNSDYRKFIAAFEKAAPLIPVPVLNATRQTRLSCFPKVDLRDVL